MPKLKGGLRALYRTLELPGANPLKDAHAALDAAVLAAYGFSAKADLAQLLALNQQVAAKIEKANPPPPLASPPASRNRKASELKTASGQPPEICSWGQEASGAFQ